VHHRHAIDPLSAVLGLTAVGVGAVVAAGRADSLADNPVWWVAIVALLLGLALVPWSRGNASDREQDNSPANPLERAG